MPYFKKIFIMNVIKNVIGILLIQLTLIACEKESVISQQTEGEPGFVTGKVTDAKGNAMADVKVVIEHTVWFGTYVYATTDNRGFYKASLPASPAGSWTAKAEIERTAYGQSYSFDLLPDNINAFNRNGSSIRNFTWNLTGQQPSTGLSYGAHADLYQFGTDVPVEKVKLIFTPFARENKLIDGSTAVTIERPVEDFAGTFMARNIPIGKYTVKAFYPGKRLLLDNRHDNGEPAVEKTVVFGKNGYLAKTEYNIEFWLSE